MTDWTTRAEAAIEHFLARKRTFSVERSFALIDALAESGSASETEMQTYGSPDFVGTILGHVTTAVHGGGSVPRDGGWYSHPGPGKAYTIDPGFARAWKAARAGEPARRTASSPIRP